MKRNDSTLCQANSRKLKNVSRIEEYNKEVGYSEHLQNRIQCGRVDYCVCLIFISLYNYVSILLYGIFSYYAAFSFQFFCTTTSLSALVFANTQFSCPSFSIVADLQSQCIAASIAPQSHRHNWIVSCRPSSPSFPQCRVNRQRRRPRLLEHPVASPVCFPLTARDLLPVALLVCVPLAVGGHLYRQPTPSTPQLAVSHPVFSP